MPARASSWACVALYHPDLRIGGSIPHLGTDSPSSPSRTRNILLKGPLNVREARGLQPMPEPVHTFGSMLNVGLGTVVAIHRTTKKAVRQELTALLRRVDPKISDSRVKNWCMGKTLAGANDPRLLRCIAQYCVSKGFMGHEWVSALLSVANCPAAPRVFAEIVGGQPVEYREQRPNHRLKSRWGKLVGRDEECDALIRGLQRWPVVSIEGMEGVGKTRLALEIAYRCLFGPECAVTPPFDAVVWVSAADRANQQRWLSLVLDKVADQLGQPFPRNSVLEQRRSAVNSLLKAHRTLLVVDDFDMMADPVLFDWILTDVPEPSKVLVTTSRRHLFDQAHAGPWTVHLTGLTDPGQKTALAQWWAEYLEMSTPANRRSRELVSLITDLAAEVQGNPGAVRLALGQLPKGASLHDILVELRSLEPNMGAIFPKLLSRSWNSLTTEARYVLLALSFFPDIVLDEQTNDALAEAAGISPEAVASGLTELTQTMLVSSGRQSGQTKSFYALHTLVRKLAQDKLSGRHSTDDKQWQQWGRTARARWVRWYLQFTAQYGGFDTSGMANRYAHLASQWDNLLTVLRWCRDRQRFRDVRTFWGYERVRQFANLSGRWQDRREWFRILRDEAQRRGDLEALVDATDGLCWTLIASGQHDDLKKAESMLKEAARMLDDMGGSRPRVDPFVWCGFADDFVQLYLLLGDCEQALQWLAMYRQAIDTSNLSKSFRDRYHVHADLFAAQVAYQQAGSTPMDIDAVWRLFGQVKRDAGKHGWQRGVAHAICCLAEIQIRLGENAHLRRAHALLEEGWPLAEADYDVTQTAFYYRCQAGLAEKQGQTTEAREMAENATALFARLGMQSQEDEMQQFAASIAQDGALPTALHWSTPMFMP